jgi:hypothetical protein
MKKLTALFGLGIAGVAVCLVMTIVTGVQQNREKNSSTPITIPTPALPQ